MKNTPEENLRELERRMSELPEEMKQAVVWLVCHHDEIERMCRSAPLTPAQREACMRKAKEKNDPYAIVLLLAERRINAPEKPDKQE